VGELLPLERIVSSSLREKGFIADMGGNADWFAYHGPVRRDGRWNWVTFLDPGTGHRVALDLNPAPRGTVGQVISILGRPEEMRVLAPTYLAWFEQLVERFESGRYRFADHDGFTAVDTWNPDVDVD
jgi:hypothetical protein